MALNANGIEQIAAKEMAMIDSALTRAERAAAYADLYEVPIEDLYRRYGAVLLPRPALSAGVAGAHTDTRDE